MSDFEMHRLDFTRGTVERIDPAAPPSGILTPDERSALVALKTELREQARNELLAEIDAALRSADAARFHNARWRHQGFGADTSEADYRSASFMAEFVAERFQP